MSPKHLGWGWILSCSLAGLLAAQQPEPPAAAGAAESPDDARIIRLHLMEGSIVTGALSVENITVQTEFGTLEVPVTKIISFTPGLKSHPAEKQQIARLIQQLGSSAVKERDAAQKALSDMGNSIRGELEKYRDDKDAERKTRIEKILTELEELADDEAFDITPQPELIDQDQLETTLFTVVGRLSPESFTVRTKFGPLTVALKDIRRAERDVASAEEIHKSFSVSGANLVQFNYKNSGIRLNRGDKVSIVADGKIVMTPWGNNQFSTPEGGANFQWYIPNKIPGGALCAKIGTGGQEFKVGSKHSFVATRPGVLYFAVAMNPQFANQGYQYPGEYRVRVRVNAEE